MKNELKMHLSNITPADRQAMDAAADWQARLAKPPGSLGKLEDITIRLAGITGKVHNVIEKKRIIVLASDNGVIEEGIGSAPRSVTAAQAVNMTIAKTGMSAMARYFGNDIQVVDMGIADEYDCPAIVNRNIAKGTKNLRYEPAMTREQAVQAILTGIELGIRAKREGYDVIGVGEMGIGNTTTSSSVLAVLTGLDVTDVTGRGGGLTDANFLKKKQIITEAITLHKPDADDPVDILSKVGGFDLCAMCGVFLGAAEAKIPVVIDGLISVVAALCAARLAPAAKEYMFPSHFSFEKGYAVAVRELELEAWLQLDMRLGEGSGCPIAFQVMEAACAAANGMNTFASAAIDDSYLDEIREKDSFTV